MVNEIKLFGCRPVPIAGYLKAMAVLRLVAKQKDQSALGFWSNDVFSLRTNLSKHELAQFLLEEYRPTPIMAPWNSSGGFIGGKNAQPVDWLRHSASPRFAPYRDALRVVDRLLTQKPLTEKPKDEDKVDFLARLRAQLPDEAVEWLDAVAVITSDDLGLAPLYGTGGNDGNFEFTNNFMQRLRQLFPDDGKPGPDAERWLYAALFQEPVDGLLDVSIGQFSPGEGGGPNAGRGFTASARVNPWDFVLALEGGVLFSSAAARRLGAHRTEFSYPFTVKPTAGAQGAMSSLDEGHKSRAEMWLPIWHRPMAFAELEQLVQEGRAQVRWRAAQTGLDFARACASLGVDRGLESFQRYAFLVRYGKMYYAVPLGRFHVRHRPDVDLLDDLDEWLREVNTIPTMKEPPAAALSTLRQVKDAAFELCQYGGDVRVRELLIAAGRLDRVVAMRADLKRRIRPLVLRSPGWIERGWPRANVIERSEFAIALAIASLRDVHGVPNRAYFAPVDPRNRHLWANEDDTQSTPRQCFTGPDFLRNAISLAYRRLLDAEKKPTGLPEPERPLESPPDERENRRHPKDCFESANGFGVPISYLVPFWLGQTRDTRTNDYAWALSAYAPGAGERPDLRDLLGGEHNPGWTPYLYALLRTVFSSEESLMKAIEKRKNDISSRPPSITSDLHVPVPPEIFALLSTDKADDARRARDVLERRLAGSGLVVRHKGAGTFGLSPRRMLVSAIAPIVSPSLEWLVTLLWPNEDPSLPVVTPTQVETLIP